MIDLLSLGCAGLTGAGLLQSSAGYLALCRFARTAPMTVATQPPVTILKPLHGDEPLLEEALASFCEQDYPCFQVVFGVQDAADLAIPVVRRLQARFPALDIQLVVDPTQHGSNRKIGNLINMLPSARHDVLVIADSDMHATPRLLSSVVGTLERPGVGLVTTLWAGHCSSDTMTGRLGAAFINRDFLPSVLIGRALGREDCMGATMALRREVLERVGGLPALANHVADDALLGRLVRAKKMQVALADSVPATTVPETTLPELFAHELRWARTVKSVEPTGFMMTMVQYPLFWAALAIGISGGAPWAWMAFFGAWLIRSLLAQGVDRALQVASPLTIWCLPFRDLLSITVLIASYGSGRVAWRGQKHNVTRLAPVREGIEVR